MAADADARKCTFTVRIDATLENLAFHAPSFRFRFLEGSKKQTPIVGAAGWTLQPGNPECWQFEAVIADVVLTETLAAAIDDDPIVAFVLSDQASATAASAPATTKAGNTSARPTTATVPLQETAGRGNASSGLGRLIADVFELDTSALLTPTCTHLEQTWASPVLSGTKTSDDNESIFATLQKSQHRDRLDSIMARSLFAQASGIRSITIRISVDQPLLSPSLRRKLNPMTITIGTARRLPGTSTSRPHDALARCCRPVYAQWRFFPDRRLYKSAHTRSRLVITPGRAHSETVDWQHTTTVLCGRCDAGELYDAVHASSIEVEIHDRDDLRAAHELDKLRLKWESLHTTGVDPTVPLTAAASDDGPISPRGGVAGSRHPTPRGGSAAKPLDAFTVDEIMKHDWRGLLARAGEKFAFGVATFRLDELLLKAKVLTTVDTSSTPTPKPYMALKLTADVLARKRRAQPIGAAALAESEDDQAVPSKSDSVPAVPLDKLVKEPGAYVASGTTLSLHVALQHALAQPTHLSAPPVSLPPTSSTSLQLFSRFVLLFPYKETSTLKQLMRVLETANLRVLPEGISLRSYQLTAEEKRACEAGELDVLTGCMIIDDAFRVVVLEGLADGAMRELHRALPRTKPQSDTFRMFANEELRFTERLYTAFDVDLKRIKLRYALPILLQMPDIYMRTKVAEPCYAALTRLMELRRVSRLAEVRDLDLFPTADMLLEVESKYGESISLEDIYGRTKTGSSVDSSGNANRRREAIDPAADLDDDDQPGGNDEERTGPTHRQLRHPLTRLKAPTDATNPEFEAHRRSRQQRDYLEERRKLLEEQTLVYQQKKQQEEEALRRDPRANAPVYLYSGQKLRTQDALQEVLRKHLSSDHRATYTYGPEFQSLALSLVNADELRQTEEREARKKWTTQRGFVYPAPRPTAEYYRHPDAPSEARCEDLRMPFVDNANHPKPVSRDNNRGHDTRPEFTTLPSKDLVFGGTNGDGSVNPDYFRSVHLCGERARKEMDEALQKEQAEWERKLVVDKKQIKFLAHGKICSQPSSTGPQSTQLDKLKDILNGPVKSKPIRIVRNATLPSGKRVPLLPPPASILSDQEYVGPVAATFASTLRHTDEDVPFLATDVTTGKPKDFHFPSVSNLLTPPVKMYTTHKEIRPVQKKEKLGFLWGNHNQ